MNMFVTSFTAGDDGRLAGDRPGYYHHFKVFPDRTSATPEAYCRYVVEVVHQPKDKRYCFVRTVAKVSEVWVEILPALLQATWKPGKFLAASPSTEVRSLCWGLLKVEFSESKGRHGKHMFAHVTMSPDDTEQRLSFEVRQGEADFTALSAHVHRQCGPTPSIAAVIARQSEFRRHSSW